MDNANDLKRMVDIKKQLKQGNNDNFKIASKKRLCKIIDKKFLTTIIYALSEFENIFGTELWGNNLPEDKLSTSQLANRTRWQQVRTNILNKGHAQARGVKSELELHDIEFIGYFWDFNLEDKNG